MASQGKAPIRGECLENVLHGFIFAETMFGGSVAKRPDLNGLESDVGIIVMLERRIDGIAGGLGGGLGGGAGSGGRRRPAEGIGVPVMPPEALKALPQETPKAMTTLERSNAQVMAYFVRSLVGWSKNVVTKVWFFLRKL